MIPFSFRAHRRKFLKRRRSIYPQHPGLAASRIFPAMRRGALEIKTIAALEPVFLVFQRNLQFPLQDVQEFLTLVGVRLSASGLGSDAEQVWLHHGVAPGQQFHTYSRTSLQHFALAWRHQPD